MLDLLAQPADEIVDRPIEHVGLAPAHDGAGRLIESTFAWGTLINVYVPNSGATLGNVDGRKAWDVDFAARLRELAAAGGGGGAPPLVVVGDLNVAFADADVADYQKYRDKVAGFLDSERDGFAELLRAGELVDLWRAEHPELKAYSFFSARSGKARQEGRGWRLDYALCAKSVRATVDMRTTFPGERGARARAHTLSASARTHASGAPCSHCAPRPPRPPQAPTICPSPSRCSKYIDVGPH